jgi:hypothetical protein
MKNLLSLFKSFSRKLFQIFYHFLEEFLWEDESFPNNIFTHESMQAFLQRMVYKITYFIIKTKFER